jgi:hypothetical protein
MAMDLVAVYFSIRAMQTKTKIFNTTPFFLLGGIHQTSSRCRGRILVFISNVYLNYLSVSSPLKTAERELTSGVLFGYLAPH